MKSTEKTITKRIYCIPEIVFIELDNDISLQLQSEVPPEGPNEGAYLSTEYSKNNPFQTQWS